MAPVMVWAPTKWALAQNREKRSGAKKREMERELSSGRGLVGVVLSESRRSAWLGSGGAVSAERGEVGGD